MEIKELKFKEFPFTNKLASYKVDGKRSPAVLKEANGKYSVRILSKVATYSGNLRYEWDYFTLDKTGLVLKSMRGMSKEFNKKIRYTDMDKAVREYKDKIINEH